MPLPVLPLSSLASRVVLAQDLDTRELPLHLHRELDQYRRLEGAFTIRDVDFEVARMGEVRQEVREEEREAAWQYFLKSDVGKVMMESEVVVKRPTENKWCVSWAGQHKNTNLHLKNPVDFVHGNDTRKYDVMAEHYMNVYSSKYLENGKVVNVSKVEEHRPKDGMTVVFEESKRFKIDDSDCLTIVQRFQRPLLGLVLKSTIRAVRAKCPGDREVFFDYDTRWTSAKLLDRARRERKGNYELKYIYN